MTDPRDVILRPVVSEKSYGLIDERVYTFIVRSNANKVQIRQSVEAIWPGVKVAKVNTMNRRGKTRRNRRSFNRVKLPDRKHAVVYLTGDSKEIDIFEVS